MTLSRSTADDKYYVTGGGGQGSLKRCLGIVLGPRRAIFGCISSSKGSYLISRIEFFCQNLALALDMVIFNHFGGQKNRIWDF